MIQKIRFNFVFSNKVLIPFYLISHKVGKLYYLTTSHDVGIDSIYKTKHLYSLFCFSRPKRLDVWAFKNTLLKKLLKKTKTVGGYFERAYCKIKRKLQTQRTDIKSVGQRLVKYNDVHGKRIVARVGYIITKVESGSC
jgi:hypothetical protein